MISDNPRHETLVERFRELLAAFEDWHCRQGEPGTFEEAGRIVVKLTTLIRDSGLGEVEFHRFCAAGRDHDEDDPPDESLPTEAAMLRAIARFNYDLAPAIVGADLAKIMAADALLRSQGELSPIGRGIPAANRQRPSPTIAAVTQERSILLAHYLARREGTTFLAEHQRLVGNLTPEGGRAWNKAVDRDRRSLARSAGARRRAKLPLSAEEQEMEDRLLRHSPERLRQGLNEIRRGGKGK